MAYLAESLMYPQWGGGDGSPVGGTLGPSVTGPAGGFSVSPGMAGSALGGFAGRGLAAALTGSMLGPVGLGLGILGSAIGYGLGNMGVDTAADPGVGATGPTGPGEVGDRGDAPGSVDDSSSSSDSSPSDSSPSDSSPSDSSFADGGLVLAHMLMGKNPPGPDDGYGGLDSGEYVLRAKAVEKYGPAILGALNRGLIKKHVLANALIKK
jgi:hypothetical protein